MFKVIDNFLDDKNFKILENNILKNNFFPWFFSDHTDYLGEKNSDKGKYLHTFYEYNNSNSNYFKLLLPLIEKLKCVSLIRIKIDSNICTNEIIEANYHVDHPHKATTAIYYLNTNDGYTKFKKNKKKINSVKNRMVIFDSNKEHLGTTTTNAKRRIVLNLNYF